MLESITKEVNIRIVSLDIHKVADRNPQKRFWVGPLCGKTTHMHSIKAFILPSYESNIPKFFLSQALYNFMLFLPVWVIFLQEKHGLSLTQVTLLDSAFWLTMVLTEVPTGAVADTLGRKQSQIIGLALTTMSILLFGLAPNYPLLLLANSLWAFAITFISGADIAFFYDTLRELGREDEYPKYRGRLSAVVLVSIAVSSALGGFLGEFNLGVTFLATAALTFLGMIFVLWFKEPPLEPDPDTGQKMSYRQTLRVAFNAIRKSPGLRFALAYSSLFLLMPAAIRVTFIQPHAIAIGLPIATLGIISLLMRLFQVGGAAYAGKTVKQLGEWNLLVLTSLLVFVGLLAIGWVESWVGIALFSVTGFVTAAAAPTVENAINQQTPGAVRATILSISSLLFRLLTAILEPGVGLVADSYGLTTAFLGMALVHGLALMIVMFMWRRVWVQPFSSVAH
jgi:MFS family permease